MKNPPDKYRTMKIRLRKLMIGEKNYEQLYDVIDRTHKATIYVYQFIRAYILKEYSETQQIMIINEDVVSMAYKTIFSDSNRGPKLKEANQIIFDKFKSFYDRGIFRDPRGPRKISGKNLSEIIGYSCTDIIKNIENNVKLNFLRYFRIYVNQCTKKIISDELDKLEDENSKNEKEKELYKNLSFLEHDLLNGTSPRTENKFNKWAEDNREATVLPRRTIYGIN